MIRTLEMIFSTNGGGRRTLSVPYVPAVLEAATVKTAMESIVAKGIFTSNTGDINGNISARIVERSVSELAIEE